jgi:signal transduction histidine kinase
LLEAEKGDYRNALESYKKYHQFSDSIAKAKRTTEIARMRNWHELEQKDNENILLQEERQKQHRLITILAGTLVLLLALLSLSVYFYRQSIAKNRELKELHTVKDKLFSVIAHDLRSPMGSLMSMLKLADNNMLDTGTQAQLLRDISMRVDDTHGLLDNLLRWSKSQMQGIAPAPAYFDAQNEIQTLMISLQNIASAKQITLNNRIGNQEVYADRDMFAVVVRNLITNAIKYTSDGGNVTLNSELSGNMLVISVKDAGTGMTQEIQNSLFKLTETKSQRGTRNESGAGLGLVLCADFVKANGGSIWFASTQGEGSTFYFNIPVKGN